MGRTLKGADHSIGKLDHLFRMVVKPQIIPSLTYRGTPCPRGHVIRHSHHHWCVACAGQIAMNHCGVDLNAMHMAYLSYYLPFFNQMNPPGSPHECWICPDEFREGMHPKYPRLTALSYRAGWPTRSETLMLSKFIYNLFWGDVGALTVKRICKEPFCWNPLHLRSAFNIQPTPGAVEPLNLEFDLVLFAQSYETREPQQTVVFDPKLIDVFSNL